MNPLGLSATGRIMVLFTELGTVERIRFERMDIKGSIFNMLSSRIVDCGTDIHMVLLTGSW